MKKLFLLDAYALIFRSYYAFIKNPRINSKGLNTSAIFGFANTVIELVRKEKPDFLAVCFDPSGPNFRHELFPDYKANREATPEDIKLSVPYIKAMLEAFRIPVLEVPGYEADDLIGTLAKQLANSDLQVFMMTPDKDYAQLVDQSIKMYKPGRSGGDIEILGIDEVKQKFGIEHPIQVIDILALWGDSADNIPGAPGVGEKTAQKLIEQYQNIENLIDHTHELKGKLKESIEQNVEQIRLWKQLATIDLNVPNQVNLEDLKRQNPANNLVQSLFAELEFRNLLGRVPDLEINKPVAKSQSNYGQLDLFGSVEEETTESDGSLFTDISQIEHHYKIIQTSEEINQLIDQLAAQKSWCFDTETTSVDAINAELVGLSFSWEKGNAFYIPFPTDFEKASELIKRFESVFAHPRIEKIGQNLKYDMLVLKRYGIQIEGPLFDTMLAHYLIQPEQPHGMDHLSQIYLGYKPVSIDSLIGKKGKNQGSMRDVAIETIAEYAAEDADVTWQLSQILRKELKSNGLTNLFEEVEMPLVQVLVDIEFEGVKIDTTYLSEYSNQIAIEIAKLETQIYEQAGESFNIGSPKQLGLVLYEKLKITNDPPLTKTKQYQTSEDVIAKFKHQHPIVETILTYRGYKKLQSTYVDALPLLVNPRTGRVHTSFNQAVTSTGRLSSTNPNLQNIPIREAEGREVRKAFTASQNDAVFLSADYSQVELRIMAHLAQDENMIEAFRLGHDIHTATASKIFGKPLEQISKSERSQAKSANFGIIYGISAFGLAQNMNISRSEAKQLIEGYFATYPKVKAYMDRSIAIAREKSYVSTIFGRQRQLADIHSQNAIVRGIAERNAINAPIQGSAADIIKMAMINIHRAFKEKGLQSKMTIQVHDELNFSVLKSELEQVQSIVKYEMEHAVSLSVPLDVEIGIGQNWLEAH